MRTRRGQGPLFSRGFTLAEVIVFLVVVSLGLVVLARVFTQSVTQQGSPLAEVKTLELAQAALDEVLAAPYAQMTALAGSGSGRQDAAHITVVNAGADFGVAAEALQRVTVTVKSQGGRQVMLSAYRGPYGSPDFSPAVSRGQP